MGRQTRVGVAALCALTLIGLGAGCKNNNATDSTDRPTVVEPSIDLSMVPAERDQVSFPLDTYDMSGEQQRLVTRAFDTLMYRCLKRFGYEVPVGKPMGKPHRAVDMRFGLIDEHVAKVFGYRGSPNPEPLLGPYQSRVPAEARWLLLGQGADTFAGQAVPKEGCQGEAVRAFMGSGLDAELRNFSDDLKSEAINRAANDSRVKKLFAAWSSCMSSYGYQYNTPVDAAMHWNRSRRGDFGAPDQKELADATANVKCKKDTGLLHTWMAVNLAYEKQLVDENAEVLRQVKQATETSVNNAARILAGG